MENPTMNEVIQHGRTDMQVLLGIVTDEQLNANGLTRRDFGPRDMDDYSTWTDAQLSRVGLTRRLLLEFNEL